MQIGYDDITKFYIYTLTHMCVCVCVCVRVCVCLFTYIEYVRVYACMCVFVCLSDLDLDSSGLGDRKQQLLSQLSVKASIDFDDICLSCYDLLV